MAELSWVTPAGTIGNLPIGLEMAITLLAVDTTNNGAALTYTLIDGALPTGMTLDSATGIISGTPAYSSPSNNYFTTLSYNFIVRLSSANKLTPVDRSFSIILTNSINQDLTWITPAGSLGTVPNGEFYQLPLQVTGTGVTFKFISGELPPGMQVVAAGYLQGVPTLTTSIAVGSAENFRFTIRATNNQGHVRDQAFNLSVTNVFGPIIEPTTTSLGSFFDGSYYSQQLIVTEPNPNTTITWSNIGPLPPGVTLSSTGLLSGYIMPAIIETQWGPAGYDAGTSTSTVSATELVGNVIYQIQSLGTTNFVSLGARDNIVGTVFAANTIGGAGAGTGTAVVYNTTINDGYLVAGQTYQIQKIGTSDFTQYGAAHNTVGVIFTSTANGKYVPSGSGANVSVVGTGVVFQYTSTSPVDSKNQEFDYGPYDFNQISQTKSYSFQIRAYDGANYDLQNYIINVISRSGFTADNTQFTSDNTYLTVDATNTYAPALLTTNTTLPVGRGGSYYAFKFNGLDFQGDIITYSLSNTVGTFDSYVYGIDAGFDYGGTGPGGSAEAPATPTTAGRGGVGFDSFDSTATSKTNLPGLILDAQSGWMYGQLTPQNSSYTNYGFGIIVSKVRNGITYSSTPKYFSLPVVGDVNNKINWVTPADLGTIDNGAVSEIALEATSIESKPLVYTLLDAAGVPIRLPQGLELITTRQNNKYLGLLSGRVTFEAFSLDDYATTFDSDKMTVDKVYKFTVEASTDDTVYNLDGSILTPPSATSTREFTLALNIIDIEPYNNLYLEAMPAWDQRQIFNSVITNTEIFVPELIYRPDDPWFGVSNDIEMLFLTGLDPDSMATYANAMIKNHYTKTYTFDGIGTAVVLDENYNVKYEVVYVNVVDPGENANGIGPAEEINLTGTIANPYIDDNGNEYKIVYPNSSENMIKQLVGGVGYYDKSSLPKWMTSNQPDATNVNKFMPPLGFIKAVVLAYTIPGASKLISYRLRNSGINFNRIDFTVDRYIVDDFYTTNFNTTLKKFNSGRETTFDTLPNQNIGELVASVDYAVTKSFDEINGRPISYINSHGGIDNITNFKDGDTLIFAQQENFLNSGPYNGWVEYSDSWIGDNILTPSVEGYDSEGYDLYTIIPGYIESLQSTDNLTGDGTRRVFTMGTPASTPSSIRVYINNFLQDSTTYDVLGQTIIFDSAPPLSNQQASSTNVQIMHNNGVTDLFTGTGAINSFTMSKAETDPTAVVVYVNGVIQLPTQYSVVGTTITFNIAPPIPTSAPNIKIVHVPNQRGGIWKINIIGPNVILTPVQEILPNQRVRILFGGTYGGSIMYYDPVLNPGQTVPYYSVYKLQSNTIAKKTTFNSNSTRFFSYRDEYYTPGTEGHYLKFPQYGMFT
jgi:Putative Ig domain